MTSNHPGLSAADILSIEQTLALFPHIFDNDNGSDLDLLFTPDVVIETEKARSVEGLEAVRAWVAAKTAAAPDHQTLNVVVFVAEDGSVRARSRYLRITPTGETSNGDFLDVLVQTPRGWRIARRTTISRFPVRSVREDGTALRDEWLPRATGVRS
ncbi:nuclear transport factor 2 family protein [Patulibacter sp. NPDC049589]|uniref:nuclear transport factor 2 family protein n=1 Tax=Patulibacter sp. NPDC049589 TaxID=3154731 RepID=UPI003416F639